MARYDVASLTHPDNLSQQELVQYLSQELNKISAAFRLVDEGRQNVLSVAPPKPRVGQTVYADGVGWNPGCGAGQYQYDGTQWVYLLGTAGNGGTPGWALYTPTIFGLTTPGLGTYSVQAGHYFKAGPLFAAYATISWSAHTGTGQMAVSLPSAIVTPVGVGFQIGFFEAQWAWGAGVTDINALIAANNSRVDVYTNTSGSLAAQNIVASGTLRFTAIGQCVP